MWGMVEWSIRGLVAVLAAVAGAAAARYFRRPKLVVEFVNGWGAGAGFTQLIVHLRNYGDAATLGASVSAYIDKELIDTVENLAVSPHDHIPVALKLPDRYLVAAADPRGLEGRLRLCAKAGRFTRRRCTTYGP